MAIKEKGGNPNQDSQEKKRVRRTKGVGKEEGGRRGAETLKRRVDPEYFSGLGQKGGETTKRIHPNQYREMGNKSRAKKLLEQEAAFARIAEIHQDRMPPEEVAKKAQTTVYTAEKWLKEHGKTRRIPASVNDAKIAAVYESEKGITNQALADLTGFSLRKVRAWRKKYHPEEVKQHIPPAGKTFKVRIPNLDF